MKTLILTTTLLFGLAPAIYGAQKVTLSERSAPGLKISYTNTALIESIVRQKISTRADTENIIIKMKCYKRWKERGNSKKKAYQCEPLEIEADVPEL